MSSGRHDAARAVGARQYRRSRHRCEQCRGCERARQDHQQGTNAATSVTSSASGEYSAANLAPGTYRLEVSQPGFQSAIVDGVTLTAGATVRADVRLQVGGVTQTVEVQSQNAQMQTEDAKISTGGLEQAGG